MKIVFGLTGTLLDLIRLIWAGGLRLDGAFVGGGKFAPDGRDGSGMIFGVFIGLGAIVWGVGELEKANEGEE